MYTIYKITDTTNNEIIYIGSTIRSFHVRKKEYTRKHANKKHFVISYMRGYYDWATRFEIDEMIRVVAPIDYLRQREKELIKEHNPYCNIYHCTPLEGNLTKVKVV